jgi:GTP-binding protein
VFVDRVRINVRGGHGGAGVASFRRRKGRPRGKPDGGSGGWGGNVIVRADATVASLLAFRGRPHWSAEDGTHGQGDLRHGRSGDDLVLPVPLGTVVREEDGTILADLVQPGNEVAVASGGRGGRGNAALVDAEHRAPAFAEQGEYAPDRWIALELKLLADAALIGFPNAGKSTLIARVSAAKPKIADYPFTTLHPNLGVVAFDDREFVLADIPGLIEGAADGKGLGHEFLRHTERARALVLLLDPSPLQTDSPQAQYEVLVQELTAHSPDLAARPRIVVVGKSDLGESAVMHDELVDWAAESGFELLFVSAVSGHGLGPLLHTVADAVDAATREAPPREGFLLHRPVHEGFEITRRGGEWVVSGRAATRAVNLNDLTLPEAADLAARRLARLGVDEALEAAGAQPGDDVRIGELVFTFAPEPGDDVAEEAAPADDAELDGNDENAAP